MGTGTGLAKKTNSTHTFTHTLSERLGRYAREREKEREKCADDANLFFFARSEFIIRYTLLWHTQVVRR